jgi:hypothetical protein
MGFPFLMVIRDFHLERVAVPPPKADAPLAVDPDAMLAPSVPLEFFQPVGRRDPKVVQEGGIGQHSKLSKGDFLDILRKPLGKGAVENLFRFLILKASDHAFRL